MQALHPPQLAPRSRANAEVPGGSRQLPLTLASGRNPFQGSHCKHMGTHSGGPCIPIRGMCLHTCGNPLERPHCAGPPEPAEQPHLVVGLDVSHQDTQVLDTQVYIIVDMLVDALVAGSGVSGIRNSKTQTSRHSLPQQRTSIQFHGPRYSLGDHEAIVQRLSLPTAVPEPYGAHHLCCLTLRNTGPFNTVPVSTVGAPQGASRCQP